MGCLQETLSVKKTFQISCKLSHLATEMES